MSKPAARSPVVLVVDDEPTVRYFLADALARQGYAAVAAGSADEAIRLIRARAADIELALIELRLPGGDGLTLGRTLRCFRPGLPCGYITWGRDVAAEPLLYKPFVYRDLLAFVRRLLSDKALPAEFECDELERRRRAADPGSLGEGGRFDVGGER